MSENCEDVSAGSEGKRSLYRHKSSARHGCVSKMTPLLNLEQKV